MKAREKQPEQETASADTQADRTKTRTDVTGGIMQCRFAAATTAQRHTTDTRSPANLTGLPDGLKNGLESLSGFDLSPVRVHYNSPEPAQVGALAYAQGTSIYLGRGQEKHLPHESWHVVQQMQGRVRADIQYKGISINNDQGLEREADSMGLRALRYGQGEQQRPLVRKLPPGSPAMQRVEVDLDDDNWLEEWYAKDPRTKSRTPQQKYMQILNNLMPQPDSGEDFSERLKQIDWPGLVKQLQLLAAIMSFHMHISPYIPLDKQGRDRNRQNDKRGNYLRSNEHRYREIYRETLKVLKIVEDTGNVLPPVNLPFVSSLQQTASSSEPIRGLDISDDSMVISSTAARNNFASLAIMHSNYTLLQRVLELISESEQLLREEAYSVVFSEPKMVDETYGDTGRLIKGADSHGLAPLLDGTVRLLDKRVAQDGQTNFHDQLLADRSALVADTAESVNASNGNYSAIHTEGHPNLILNDSSEKRGRKWQKRFVDALNKRKTGDKWKILATVRASFGHQRPSVAEVDKSLRFSAGFAPAETMQDSVLGALGIQKSGTDKFNFEDARIHVEALKTAVRHAQIAIRRGAALPSRASPVLSWLQTRLIINLRKSMFLLDKYEDRGSDFNINQHYIKSMDVLENLQEYSIIYTAYTLDAQKATQTEDPYENYLRSADFITGPETYRIFYLDSGMQALNMSAALAREFKESGTLVGKNLDAYYEFSGVATSQNIYTSKGRARHVSVPATDDEFIITDLSPVVTELGKLTSDNSTKAAHFARIRGNVGEDDIPVLDITNSTLADVSQLIRGGKTKSWAKNYILVNSLIKLHQLGSDKFIQGRMIVVGTPEFLQVAEEVIGPVAGEARNELANAVRMNLDQAIYGNAIVKLSGDWSRSFKANATQYNEFMRLMGLEDLWLKVTGGGGIDMDVEDTEEDSAGGWRVLNSAFDEYVTYAVSGGKPEPKYEAAFKALPPADQRELVHRAMRIVSPQETRRGPELALTGITQTGIENVGNSCYLAAGLTMLAFSPYSAIFQQPALLPMDETLTQKEQLRRMIGGILYQIQSGQTVDGDRIHPLLRLLGDLDLLPRPSAAAIARGAQAISSQQDPNEVFFRKILDFFADEMETAGMHLNRTYRTQIESPGTDPLVADANPAHYSALGHDNILQEPPQGDAVLELATTGAADLRQAMARYLAEQQITDVKYRVGDNQVRQGTARRRILLGGQRPAVITLALIRWAGIAKDTRSIDMPERFVLNGEVYRLNTVVYHHGATPDSGHYTASNRVLETDNWQYRDDRTVGDDEHFAARKGRGYLFTYAAVGPAGPEDAALLRLDNPGPVADIDDPLPESGLGASRKGGSKSSQKSNISPSGTGKDKATVARRYIQKTESLASWLDEDWDDFKYNCVYLLVSMKAWRELGDIQDALAPYYATDKNAELLTKEIEFQWRQAGCPPIG